MTHPDAQLIEDMIKVHENIAYKGSDHNRVLSDGMRAALAVARQHWEQRIRAEIMDCGFRIAELKNEQGWWVKDDQFKLLNRIGALEWAIRETKS